jgi:CII-binding regulator of phage lambda lysogenization HflD
MSLLTDANFVGVYKYKVTLLVTGFNDSSCKIAVTGPTGSTLTYGLDITNPKVSTGGTGLAVTLTDSTLSVIVIEGTITLDTTHSGNLQVQIAQNVSQNDQLTTKAGSMLEVWQINDTNPTRTGAQSTYG